MLLLPIPARAVTLAQTLSALLLPHGGQAGARRNAWSGIVADARCTRDRREAEAALAVAVHRAAVDATYAGKAIAGR